MISKYLLNKKIYRSWENLTKDRLKQFPFGHNSSLTFRLVGVWKLKLLGETWRLSLYKGLKYKLSSFVANG